jgi:hypothetical protein
MHRLIPVSSNPITICFGTALSDWSLNDQPKQDACIPNYSKSEKRKSHSMKRGTVLDQIENTREPWDFLLIGGGRRTSAWRCARVPHAAGVAGSVLGNRCHVGILGGDSILEVMQRLDQKAKIKLSINSVTTTKGT